MVKNKKLVWVGLGVLVGVSVVAWVVVWELNKRGDLEVVFFDIGQGDSIFIETRDGFQVLIDGGPGLVVLEKLGQEMPFYDRGIDLMILTHPERDHMFGLLEVLKRYQVKNILWTGIIRDTAQWREWERLIKEEGAKLLIAEAGQKINISQDIYFLVLHPLESLEGLEVKDSNDTSVVAQLVFKDNSFLFTGDISKKIEKKLVEEYQEPASPRGELSSSILKIAHHGSKSSTSLEFLEMVSPETAIISVGENQWGHPHPEVLSNLEQFGIHILTTRNLGDIKFTF